MEWVHEFGGWLAEARIEGVDGGEEDQRAKWGFWQGWPRHCMNGMNYLKERGNPSEEQDFGFVF